MCPLWVFLDILAVYFQIFHDWSCCLSATACVHVVCVKYKLLFSPTGKTLSTVINNCPHVKNNLMDAQSKSSRLHYAFPTEFTMPI